MNVVTASPVAEAPVDPAADVVVCPTCRTHPRRGDRCWSCPTCERSWPALLGIPDMRPGGGAPPGPDELPLVEAYRDRSFEELLAMRASTFSTDDPALLEIYARYRAGMQERGRKFLHMIRARLAERWAPPNRGCGLVIGCGAGSAMLELGAQFERVVGVDPCLADLVLARKAAEERGMAERVTLIQGYAQSLPIADGAIDLAIAEDVLEHVFDLETTFRELARVLAPGGQFAGNSVNRYNLLRPEPHVRLWFLGFLPRSLHDPYVYLRRRFEGYSASCRLPSWRELSTALRNSFGDQGHVVFPGVEPYGFPPRFDRLLQAVERFPPLALPLLWVFPSHLAIARKT